MPKRVYGLMTPLIEISFATEMTVAQIGQEMKAQGFIQVEDIDGAAMLVFASGMAITALADAPEISDADGAGSGSRKAPRKAAP